MKLFAFTIFLTCAFSTIAQQTVTFGVYDRNDNEPVDGALATVLNCIDSTLVSATLADEFGRVSLTIEHPEEKIVMLTCPGYDSKSMPAAELTDSLFLYKRANELDELVVKHEMFTRTAGKFVFNPGELRNSRPSVLEVAKLTPLVRFDNSTAYIMGKGQAEIRINGRNLKMSADALANYLRSMPAECVKSIEVITSTGATEGSTGTDAVVNIIIDNPYEGLLGSASTTFERYGRRYSADGSIWLGYSNDKISVSGSFMPEIRESRTREEAKYQYGRNEAKNIYETTTSKSRTLWLTGSITGQYNISDQSNAGITFNIDDGQQTARSTSESAATSDLDMHTTHMGSYGKYPWKRPTMGAIAYYTVVTDSLGSSLDFSADFSSLLSKGTTEYLIDGATLNQHTRIDRKALSLKPNYLWKINPSHRLAAGYEYYYGKINHADNYNLLTNDFSYTEHIHSAYAEWSADWSRAFSMKAGLRMESSSIAGNTENGTASFSRNETELMPSLSLSLDLPRGGQNISLDMKRRLSRPFYQHLNPVMEQTSPTTYAMGNPNLKPVTTWSGSLYYSFLKHFVLIVAASYSPNTIDTYTFSQGDITMTTAGNFGRNIGFNPGISYSNMFGRLYISASAEASYHDHHAMLNDVDISYNDWSGYASIRANYTLSKEHDINISGSFSIKTPTELTARKIGWYNYLGFEINKRWNNGLYIALSGTNLLNYKGNRYYESPEYSYDINNVYDKIGVSLSFRYNFGKRTVKAAHGKGYNALKFH